VGCQDDGREDSSCGQTLCSEAALPFEAVLLVGCGLSSPVKGHEKGSGVGGLRALEATLAPCSRLGQARMRLHQVTFFRGKSFVSCLEPVSTTLVT
jgi:hypothetical protein